MKSTRNCYDCNITIDRYIRIPRESMGLKFHPTKPIINIPLCSNCWFKKANAHIKEG